MIFQSSMCHIYNIAVIFTYLLSCTTLAIRVDWNTNHGPIIPPTSTLPPVPKPPFREPAAVWEDQSNDVPNPNQYVYVPPPPSRPRLNNPDDTNQQQAQQQQPVQQQGQYQPQPQQYQSQQQPQQQQQQQQQQTPQQQEQQPQVQQQQPQQPQQQPQPTLPSSTTTSTTSTIQPPVYGTILSHPNQIPDVTKPVASLATKYIPNYGNKYVAVVPSYQKSQYLTSNDVYDKYNGKYNAKLKKYKAYEQKAKLVPYFMFYQPKHQYTFYNNFPAKSDVSKHWSENNVNYNQV